MVPETASHFGLVDFAAARRVGLLSADADVDVVDPHASDDQRWAALKSMAAAGRIVGGVPWLCGTAILRTSIPPYGPRAAEWVLNVFGTNTFEIVHLRPNATIAATNDFAVDVRGAIAVVHRHGAKPPLGHGPPAAGVAVGLLRRSQVTAALIELRDSVRGAAIAMNVDGLVNEWMIVWLRPDLEDDVLADRAALAIATSRQADVFDLASARITVDNGVATIRLRTHADLEGSPRRGDELIVTRRAIQMDPLYRLGFPYPIDDTRTTVADG